MADDIILERIANDLGIIKSLLLADYIKGRETKESVDFLSKLGMKSTDISEFLGITPGAIRVAKHRSKKNSSKDK
jgi:hypothetical protein